MGFTYFDNYCIEKRINLFGKNLQNPNDDKMEYIYQL